MTMHVKVDGSYRPVEKWWMRDGGAWHTVMQCWMKEGGVWRVFYDATPVTPPPLPPAPPSLSTGASPSNPQGSRVGAGYVATPGVGLTPSGGYLPYSYGWVFVTGDTRIMADAPDQQFTMFSGVIGSGETASAQFQGRVRDNQNTVATVAVNVQLSASNNALAVSGPGSITNNRSGAGVITSDYASIGVSGGSGSYSYNWQLQSGPAFTLSNPNGASTSFSYTLLNGQDVTSIHRCTVQSTDGSSSYADVTVRLYSDALDMSVDVVPSTAYKFRRTTGAALTDNITATITNGSAPFTYVWMQESGNNLTITEPNSATTRFGYNFTTLNTSVTAVYRCFVTDTSGQMESDTVEVTLECGSQQL